MDADRLRYFCAVARTGSLRRAAELLKISPPALSKAVHALEAECGARLVEPAGRGLTLTEAGRRLAEEAGPLLARMDGLRASLQGSTAPARELRLGSFEVFTTHALAEITAAAGKGVSLLLHELVPGKLEDALAARRIDWGITYAPIPHPDLEFLPAAIVRMGVFGRADSFAKDAQDPPFVVPVTPIEGSPTKILGLDGWPDHAVPRRVHHRVTLLESALELCRLGQAVAFLPAFIVKRHNERVLPEFRLSSMPHPEGLTQTHLEQPVYLVKRKGFDEASVGKRLAKALRILCR